MMGPWRRLGKVRRAGLSGRRRWQGVLGGVVFCFWAAWANAVVESILLEPHDQARDRTIPIKVYLDSDPEAGPLPVILFSHGLGGSREGAAYLGEYWAEHGYLAILLQHPGSDRAVWQGTTAAQRDEALQAAMRLKPYLDRVLDVKFILDTLEAAQEDPAHPLHGRVDLSRIGMSGHSYGSHTSQALMGQRNWPGSERTPLADPRINCFILMSPSPHKRLPDGAAFGQVTLPVLCLTGTLDTSPLGRDLVPEDRRRVYAGLPEGDKYQLVFDGGDHMVFSGFVWPGQPPPDPRYHRAIQRLSTAFLDAYLKEDAEAKAWLKGDGVREMLVQGDIWEWK